MRNRILKNLKLVHWPKITTYYIIAVLSGYTVSSWTGMIVFGLLMTVIFFISLIRHK
jgi:hypothetical protein